MARIQPLFLWVRRFYRRAAESGANRMLKVDRNILDFILAGRPTTIHTTGPYKQGRDYALGLKGRRSSTCRVQILDIRENTIIVILQVRDTPRLLAAHSQYGYTDDIHKAMRDEPEAISAADQQRISSQAHARQLELQRDQRARQIAIALKEASRRSDRTAYRRLFGELGLIAGTAVA